jgi:hypothetical protein
VGNTPNDTMELASNVLIAAGLGKRYDFAGSADTTEAGDTMGSYRDALRVAMENLYGAIMTSMLMGLPSWAMSKKLLEMKSCVEGG